MKYITQSLDSVADVIREEIDSEKSEYFWPKAKDHKVFEQAYMKFLNRNLNYFDFPNMLAQTEEDPEFNSSFPKTLAFCNFVRTLTGDKGPFGRMCVWNLPQNKQLLPHVDNFEYHRCIVRNIFIISDNSSNQLEVIINNEPVRIKKGTLFQFSPAYERHAFVNNTAQPFYFLGFDFWNGAMLERAKAGVDLAAVRSNPERAKFGGPGTKAKYISKH